MSLSMIVYLVGVILATLSGPKEHFVTHRLDEIAPEIRWRLEHDNGILDATSFPLIYC